MIAERRKESELKIKKEMVRFFFTWLGKPGKDM